MTVECSLLYVSRVTIDPPQRDEEIESILAWSHAHNPRVGITGGLVRAKGWFAQLLEGPNGAVETLMKSIERDPRHSDVRVLRVAPLYVRQLGNWSMAYAGEWHYNAQIIADIFEPGLGDGMEKLTVSKE